MTLKLKICGLKDNPEEVAACHPDYLGFIFYPDSPRYVEKVNIPEKFADIKKVGVFVNEEEEQLKFLMQQNQLDYAQLHGNESPEYCERLKSAGIPLIKAFHIHEKFNFQDLEPYKDHVDFYLFDTRTTLYGGSGKRFNWEVLKKYDQHKPFFLSGGLDEGALEDIPDLKGMNLAVLDLNSGVETAPGKKNIEKIERFIEKLNQLNNEVFSG